MNRRSSSQVGLFSAQISEQIQRLRTLTQSTDGPSEAHQVDLRRAVMATRLLAGSARILGLEFLHRFLDELLAWLQRIAQSSSGVTSTQSLILESVVELEEALITRLDEGARQDSDLDPFRSQIEDILQLMRHNLERLELEAPKVASPEEDVASAQVRRALEEAVAEHRSRLARESDPVVLKDLVEEAQLALSTLRLALDDIADRQAQSSERRWTRRVTDLEELDDPASDPVVGPAIGRLRTLADRFGFRFRVEAFGSGADVAKSVRGSVGEILGVLVQDVAAAVEAADATADMLHLSFEIRREQGRVRILCADDGPRGSATSALGDSDHLALFSGLRRARSLLTQLRGLIRVEPADASDVRFEITVPQDLENPAYVIVPLDGQPIAVPASLYETTLDAAGLLYEADEAGESIQHARRSIPLLDLGQCMSQVMPATSTPARIVVVGDVEKRLGLGIDRNPEIVRTQDLGDAPEGWESMAYASLEHDGATVPVVDVRRLLQLRFRPVDDAQIAGASADPFLEDLDPTRSRGPLSSGSVRILPIGRPQRALLVNQSEFRRRELQRVLLSAGLQVEECVDLAAAAARLGEDRFDLLVTDLRLGQEVGQSFSELRKEYRGLRVILTSSVAQQYAHELADRTGANRCWLDPYRRSDLEIILNELQA